MFNNLLHFLINQTPLLYLTQSLWRDEAFSVWIAEGSFAQIVARTSGDFNPPLYYILLSLWMNMFGKSEIALRSLSLVLFLGFLYVVYRFAYRIFRSRQAALVTFALAATNPMLVYYAFELRMYSQLVLFSTLSMYFLYTKNWKWHIVTSTLGLYTHPFMALVLLSQGIFSFLTKKLERFIKNIFFIGILFLPWLPTLLSQFKQSGPMWIYPVDLNLILSSPGSLYFGYEGTPGQLWYIMKYTSLVLLAGALWLVRYKKFWDKALLIYLWIFVPLVLVLGASFIKPLYVNRYVIFVSVGEIFLIAAVIAHIKNKSLQRAFTYIILLVTISVNIQFVPSFHRKVDLKNTFTKIVPLLTPNDVVFARTPLVYYETIYYTPAGIPVYLYNPYELTPPRFVGSVGMPRETWANTYPIFPKRAFIVEENGEFVIASRLNGKVELHESK